MTDRPTSLVEFGHFRRSFRANGPNRSFVRVAAALQDRFRFRVISLAEAGDPIAQWHDLEGLERIALPQGRVFAKGLRAIIRQTPHDILVCNGLFNRPLTLPTLLMKRTGQFRTPVLLAPRDEFSPGGLGLHPLRKSAYLRFLEASGLLRNITLQATDDAEAARIAAKLPGVPVVIGPNVRTIDPLPAHSPREPGAPLRIVFLSRIDPMKNLDWAIDFVARSHVAVCFDVFGPIADVAYWNDCRGRSGTCLLTSPSTSAVKWNPTLYLALSPSTTCFCSRRAARLRPCHRRRVAGGYAGVDRRHDSVARPSRSVGRRGPVA